MIQTINSIRDSKAEAWLTPMFFQSNAQALRSFSDAANDKNLPIGLHPEDYTLFQLGTWDERKGEMERLEAPKAIALGSNLVEGD